MHRASHGSTLPAITAQPTATPATNCTSSSAGTASVDTPASVPESPAWAERSSWTAAEHTGMRRTRNGASALSYIPETSWNTTAADGEPAASGGGLSTFFSKPSWQVGPGVPGNNARNVPDIALNADPDNDGYIVFTDGSTSPQVYRRDLMPDSGNGGNRRSLESVSGRRRVGKHQPSSSTRSPNRIPLFFIDVTTGNNIVDRRQVTLRQTPSLPSTSDHRSGYTASARLR